MGYLLCMVALYGALPLILLQIYVLICAVNEALGGHHKVIYVIRIRMVDNLLQLNLIVMVHSYKACIASSASQ